MINHIVKWGVIVGVFMAAISTIGYAVFPMENAATFKLAALTGYAGMFIGVLLIFFAYNEHENAAGTALTYKTALLLGLGVTLIAGAIFGLFNVLYSQVFVPDFLENYYAYELEHTGLVEGEAFEQAKLQFEQTKAFLQVPLNGFIAMASAVWLLGAIAALILPVVRKLIKR